MRKLLNVLYVTTPESYLALEGDNIVILADGTEKFRIPLHNIEGIVCFGYMGASPALMGYCADRCIGLSFVTPGGRFLARVTGGTYGNVLLRKKQYRLADQEADCVPVAVNCITGKILNARFLLQRGIRDHGGKLDINFLKETSAALKKGAGNLQKCTSLEEIRGIEGDCAKRYFCALDQLILQQKDVFYLSGRSKRPPLDHMNALLSFLYTLLAHDVQSALETVGLDPYVGFLHRDRPGRASLALDLMEELRPFLADRLALSLVNRKQISEKGFSVKESGGILMDDETRKNVITAWQSRKQEKTTHPFLNEKIEIGLVPYAQSLLLARHLRGDIEAYPPFIWE
jgi:CRISPR-associated protein Cas1